jgi:hypothetical protein
MGWYGGERESYYDTAQVCMNGHMVNDRASGSPQHNEAFCERCGQPTITSCPACGTALRGYYHSSVVVLGGSGTPAPIHCYKCGKPLPWTEAKLAAARELTDELDGLTDDERERLKANLHDLIAETPRTEVAVVQTKKLLAKASGEARSALVDVLRGVVREAIKGTLFGG